MAEENKLKIKLKVGDREYEMTIFRADEYHYRLAAKKLNEKYATYLMLKGLEPIDCYALIALESYINSAKKEVAKEEVTKDNKLEGIKEMLDSYFLAEEKE